MIIEIEHKKKAYVAPEIEVVTCDAGELMDASVMASDHIGDGTVDNSSKSSNNLFSFYGDDEDDFFAVDTEVEVEEPDAIDEIINRLR